MLEPTEYLSYVYYKCSHCGETGDEVRLRETKSGIHICLFCGNEDEIKPITGIDFRYSQHKESKKRVHSFNSIDGTKYAKVVNSLKSCGWSQEESRLTINAILKGNPDISPQELFRLAILELDEKQQQAETD
jgi:hypothetical protein